MDIFEKDLSGAMVSPEEPGYEELIGTIFDTMKTAAEMNAKGWLSYTIIFSVSRVGKSIPVPRCYLRFTWISARTSASVKAAGFSKDARFSTVAASPSATVCSSRRK